MSPRRSKLKIAFVCNTRRGDNEFQAEYEPQHTLDLVKAAVEKIGHEYLHVEADENAFENLRRLRPHLVLNRAEGIRGESRESHIPAICEMLDIPYTGASIMSTAICLDKPTTKKILEFHGIRTAPFQVISDKEERIDPKLRYPLILKPSHEGSSMGINLDNIVHDEKGLRRKLKEMIMTYREPILAEEFIDGREFSVGIIGNHLDTEEPKILPILEVDFSRFDPEVGTVYGQKAKTIDTSENYICPAEIPEPLRKRIEETTKRVVKILGCYDWGRLDYRYNSKGELYFLEINPLPGIDYDEEEAGQSLYPFMWYAAGLDYDEMIKQVIAAAIKRYGLK